MWRTIALPLFDELDMTDGGDDYFILDKNGRPGRPNPKEWGDRYTADFRRAPRNLKGRSKYGPKK